MKIKAILFDLDGTLLPMNQDAFVKEYFKTISESISNRGYDKDFVLGGIIAGCKAMFGNDGKTTNEKAFESAFKALCGDEIISHPEWFDEYYRSDFLSLKRFCGYDPSSAEALKQLKEKGYTLVLATNPLFPPIATEERMSWAGISPDDFLLYTTYQNSSYCKPNPKYYAEILEKLALSPEECVMVGNDTRDDMVAEQLGINVFLMTDCLINADKVDITKYHHGGFGELIDHIEHLSQ